MAQKKGRTNRNLEGVEKTFLETCFQEITLRVREGSSLKPHSWKDVGEKLKIEHNFIVDQKQMKNRYDYTKSKFAAWLKLKNKTGNVYDPITNTLNLSEEEWETEIKSNKFVEALKRVPLSYPELCVQLFEGSTSTGFASWGPSSTLPHPNEEVFEQNLDGIEDVVECTQVEPPTQGVSSDESTVQSKQKREKRKEKSSEDSELVEIREVITKVAKIWIEKHELSNDMDACMEKLESMGWEETYGNKRKRDMNSALTGHAYTQELLHGSSTQCHEMMRLSREAFVLLCNHFKQKNWLQSSRFKSLEENLAMFFMVIGHNERFRMVKRRFQHSTETIHRCFHEVLNAMMNFAREVIVPTYSNANANTSERNRRLKEIFPGAIGALDGTLVHAIVPADQQTRYRGRGKGECFQNVLAICDFDMIFMFVWAGWEGLAHDSRVLKEVAFNQTSGFPFP